MPIARRVQPGEGADARAFLAVVVAIGTTMLLAGWLASWGRASNPTELHWSTTLPVLGGHEPEAHAWNRFHARYYPMALVLMAFEMEMMFRSACRAMCWRRSRCA